MGGSPLGGRCEQVEGLVVAPVEMLVEPGESAMALDVTVMDVRGKSGDARHASSCAWGRFQRPDNYHLIYFMQDALRVA